MNPPVLLGMVGPFQLLIFLIIVGGIGVAIYFIVKAYQEPAKNNQPQTQKPSTIQKTVSNITKGKMTEEQKIKAIKEYKELLDNGTITEAEFEKKKGDLLN